MLKTRLLSPLIVASMLFAASGVVHATAISGSVPFGTFGDTENGTNLVTSTFFTDASTVTSGGGSGDFAIVPVDTTYTAFDLNLTTLSTGGGFTISNPNYGSFTATGGSIVFRTPDFLNVDLRGIYTPGPAFGGLGPAPATIHLGFTKNGESVSASFTLATVPEPGTMALLGLGILTLAVSLRRRFPSATSSVP